LEVPVPNIKSAIKRVAVAERNRARNRFWKSNMRTARTKVEEAIEASKPADAATALHQAYSMIDKAVSKGVLHKNAANRRKSRLAKQLSVAAAAPTK
jgi:small subunit ribosomal protein S20